MNLLLALSLCASLLDLREPVKDKNFYLLSLIERDPVALHALKSEPTLERMTSSRTTALKSCALDLDCYINALTWTDGQIALVQELLVKMPAMKRVAASLRATHTYIRYEGTQDLLALAWADCARGLNRALAVYGSGTLPPHSPSIDGMAYDPKSDFWKRVIQTLAASILEERVDLFFQPSLRFAVELMELNHRDEAGRFEPMERGENAKALNRIPSIIWNRYPYSVILVPGSGNEIPGVRLSPGGRLRDEIAARRYRDGKAPFILLSGGFVHPNRTEYSEAIEMKLDLMNRFHIPESSILVDPHARHTTTNMRNAARILYRYGIPFQKKALVTTDLSQSLYITTPVFEKRCKDELGYLPYKLLSRISPFDVEFLPQMEALMIDSRDLLDP